MRSDFNEAKEVLVQDINEEIAYLNQRLQTVKQMKPSQVPARRTVKV